MPNTDTAEKIFIGKGQDKDAETSWLTLALANRHGLATGATGTGKTVSLQIMAEGFARAGVPVFAADIKGDLSGIAALGEAKDFITKRAKDMDLPWQADEFSTVFWDVFGEQGHPVRATVSEMGPLLLARMLDLNDVQEGVLNVAFKIADEEGLPLLDFKDLRAILDAISPASGKKAADDGGDDAKLADIKAAAQKFGNVTKPTVGTIQRQLLVLENQGGEKFFGEPALQLKDFIRTDNAGRGMINILAADKLMSSPRLYATFLLWMLSELFEELPEAGDPPKPKLVFFFDEAHLLFTDAPKALLDKIEQVVRLIRSKGVGVYFVTQNPIDVPDRVLAQLGNRIQHALRAFTPRDQKAVAAAAQTFRPNPKLDTAKVITELGKGEALVSFLEGNGTPAMVERVFVRPPTARMGPITADERKAIMAKSPVKGRYDTIGGFGERFRNAAQAACRHRCACRHDRPDASRSGASVRARQDRRHRRQHLRHQPAQGPKAVHGASDRARSDALGNRSRGWRRGRATWPLCRRIDGRLDRPLDRARRAGWAVAEVIARPSWSRGARKRVSNHEAEFSRASILGDAAIARRRRA